MFLYQEAKFPGFDDEIEEKEEKTTKVESAKKAAEKEETPSPKPTGRVRPQKK